MRDIVDIPRDFFHDIPDEGSSLAKVTLGARNTLLGLARRDFLDFKNR